MQAVTLFLEKASLDLDYMFDLDDLDDYSESSSVEGDLRRLFDKAGRGKVLSMFLPRVDHLISVSTRFLTSAIAEITSAATLRTSGYLFTPSRYLLRVQAIDDVHAYSLHTLRANPREPEQVEPYQRYTAAVERFEAIDQELDQVGGTAATTMNRKKMVTRSKALREVEEAEAKLVAPDRHFQLEQRWNGAILRFALVSGFSHLALDAVLLGDYMDYYPPYFDEDLAIEVEWVDGPLTHNEAHAASLAYQYSLETSLGLKLKPSERTPVDELPDFEEDRHDALTVGRIRQLRDGPGQNDLHALYLRAIATSDLEIQHLFFTKVVEYVSQTVLRQERNEAVRQWLRAERALRPDAEYIEDLARAVAAHDRRARDDLSALKLTVVTCCEAQLLAPQAPQFLSLASITSESSPQERKQALERLAETIQSTRNEIAHAKANYEPTGRECPPAELGALVRCMRQVAQMAIAWYGDQPAHLRYHR